MCVHACTCTFYRTVTVHVCTPVGANMKFVSNVGQILKYVVNVHDILVLFAVIASVSTFCQM